MMERRSAVRLETSAGHVSAEGMQAAYDRTCERADDPDVSATGFWLDADLESMLATVQPYEGAGEFAIEDLTEEEWGRFVAALRE